MFLYAEVCDSEFVPQQTVRRRRPKSNHPSGNDSRERKTGRRQAIEIKTRILGIITFT